MRRTVLFFLLLSIFSSVSAAGAPVYTAYSAPALSYARVLQSDVFFCKSPAPEGALFTLSVGYYVTVTGESGDYYSAEYQSNAAGYYALNGYVRKTAVTLTESVPEAPLYPSVTLTVTAYNAVLKDGVENGGGAVAVCFKDSALSFYGEMKDSGGGAWYFVKYGDYFGYVPSGSVSALSVPPHPTPLPTPPPSPRPSRSAPAGESQGEGGETNKTLLIAGITVPAVIIVILLFAPSKRKRKDKPRPSFLDEIDEEL